MARALTNLERTNKTNSVTFDLVTACFEVMREYRNSPFLRLFSKKRQEALNKARDIFDSKLCYASAWYNNYAPEGRAKTNLHGMLGFADTIYKLVK
jgi:lysyl-tRNA synthetase class I